MKKILLLGSGELGKELTISLKRIGCNVIACDAYENAPAMQVSDKAEIFNMLDKEKLKEVINNISQLFFIKHIKYFIFITNLHSRCIFICITRYYTTPNPFEANC